LIPPKAVEREEIVKAWKIVFKNGDVVLTENEETAESWCRDGQEIIDLHGTRIVRKPQEWEVIPAWVSRKSFRIEPSDTDDIYIIGFRPKVEK
jgi:hypothetical protein